eukprot:2009325-Pyramimonas_sp.AAC.1
MGWDAQGVLSSLDDFYLMDTEGSALAMIQTTNSVLDPSAYDGNVDPQSMLAWQVRPHTPLIPPLVPPCSWESWVFTTLVNSVLDVCAPRVLYNTP